MPAHKKHLTPAALKEARRLQRLAYRHSEKGLKAARDYMRTSPVAKENNRTYRHSSKNLENQHRYRHSPLGRETWRRHNDKRKDRR